MADLTRQITIESEWLNLSVAAGLTAGASYTADLPDLDTGATVYQAVTDDETAPSEAIFGHPWRANSVQEDAATRTLTPVSGQTLWMRVSDGTATLVITEA